MSKVNDGGPAFPRSGFELDISTQGPNDTKPQDGMSLRDWFAGQAMVMGGVFKTADQANDATVLSDELARRIAEAAYMLADAMIAQRTK